MNTRATFDEVVAHGAATINKGSQSFAVATKLFSPDVRDGAVMLYAWCRHCDDVIDDQVLGQGRTGNQCFDGARRLLELRKATSDAYSGKSTIDPVFAGIAEVVRRYHIAPVYLEQHLDGFAMDIAERHYLTLSDTLEYCWHVAGVVGVMMAHIMGSNDPATLNRACDLGMAFQLTNIARDVVEDAKIGRVYLPADWLRAEDIPSDIRLAEVRYRPALARVAQRLVRSAEPYYESAVAGLASLPLRSAWSIATARSVYRAIGHKVVARGAHAWDSRTRTTSAEKALWVAAAATQAAASRTSRPSERDGRLFRRPI